MADARYKYDTTGMAEPFHAVEERLKALFVDMAQRHGTWENSNILVQVLFQNLIVKAGRLGIGTPGGVCGDDIPF